MVVLADADIAVQDTLKAIFINAGQVCSAGSRLVVERKVHAEMLERLVAAASGSNAATGSTIRTSGR